MDQQTESAKVLGLAHRLSERLHGPVFVGVIRDEPDGTLDVRCRMVARGGEDIEAAVRTMLNLLVSAAKAGADACPDCADRHDRAMAALAVLTPTGGDTPANLH